MGKGFDAGPHARGLRSDKISSRQMGDADDARLRSQTLIVTNPRFVSG